MTFKQLIEKYHKISFSKRDMGTRFERLMMAYLHTAPEYAKMFKHIWAWSDFPYKGESFTGEDTGIDLVAQTVEGDFWAVQCKLHEKGKISKGDVDSFLASSSKEFKNDKGELTTFAKRLWIATTKLGPQAEQVLRFQKPEVIKIGLQDLIKAPVDWEALENGIHGNKARNPQKIIRPHQERALQEFHNHFQQGNTRGKLIMACGTGKTYTALKIVENETGGKGLVLFLAPSIALIGQTLKEWSAEARNDIRAICVCSDSAISREKKKNKDLNLDTIIDLAYPATTDIHSIVRQMEIAEEYFPDSMTVIFSTYQSLGVVAEAQKIFKREFDIIICDEAHRTTGVTLKDEEESAFVKVHDNDFIQAKKRLYMTATPRIYHPNAKTKAEENDAVLCSMDDERLYGKEVYRLGFGEAVDKNLLSDYKVLVLTVTQADIPQDLQSAVANRDININQDDAAKLVGCINALSKRMLLDEGLLKNTDPQPMRKAVAFCSTIKNSKLITDIFNEWKEVYYQSLPYSQRKDLVEISAQHIDGTMGADERAEKLSWLNSVSSDSNECHILDNVRCLSEGVDVPSLDAVMFLSSRDSHIDVVQSVGRVMRTAPNKKFGYIIIPVLVPEDELAEENLDKNGSFKVVWNVLTALRAHDDRFDSIIKKIELNDGSSPDIIPGRPGSTEDSPEEPTDGPKKLTSNPFDFERIKALQNAVYARMVLKVGNRLYWEQWAQSVADIAKRYSERIRNLIAKPGPHLEAFNKFLSELQQNINPAVTAEEVVEMLAQHYITKPVFEALFENYSFVNENAVSKAMQDMIALLEEQALEKDTEVLSRFYESMRNSVSKIDNAPARQKIITELYDKFFRTAFPLTVQRLGIVYTPIEIVDFINRSVAEILEKTFDRSISDRDINILDPFTGTGTFIARLIESGLINRDSLDWKYENCLFANELILLAYYIASINIENSYHNVMGDDTPYKPFTGICLTDTFQVGEEEKRDYLLQQFMKRNSERVEREKKTAIQVIMGNPPYSVGQKSANDRAQNQKYPILDERIANTYAKLTNATNKNSLYDSYIRAFRWASDRIDKKFGGIIAFVSNAGWLDGNAMNGFRKTLEAEFKEIYVFNLRGNCRTSGEQRRKEKGNVFGLGSKTPIAITILVKNPRHQGKTIIHYRDIGDYLSREEKLEIIAKMGSALSPEMNWQILQPDKNGDWISHSDDKFSGYIILGDKKEKGKHDTFFKPVYSNGLKTQRDAWCWNFSKERLTENIRATIDYFNAQIGRQAPALSNHKISWSDGFQQDFERKRYKGFDDKSIRNGLYRPFCSMGVYFNGQLNERTYQIPTIFPTTVSENLVICVSGIGSSKPFSTLITNKIPDIQLEFNGQCFPLYYYEKSDKTDIPLLNTKSGSQFRRKDALTDFIWSRCQDSYGGDVTKEDIFYYVYGLLHSPDYRKKFAVDLKKSLPRLPLVDRPEDFWTFSKAGRQLADLHINYDKQPACKDVVIKGMESGNFKVSKMRFSNKDDKATIIYNEDISISGIPLKAYEYVVNGRSPIEWVMERYQVKTDPVSGILNDPNDWAKEHGDERYILDLLLSLLSVSLETIRLVEELPKVEI